MSSAPSTSSQSGPPSSSHSAEWYMYVFKVRSCYRSYPHNWSACPYVHPGEKARRRDPRTNNYRPLPCPHDRKGSDCPQGDACTYTHNVYEFWLHPMRFRTQMCQDAKCKRPLCFFAHSPDELRKPEAPAQPTAWQTAQRSGHSSSSSLTASRPTAGVEAAAAAVLPAGIPAAVNPGGQFVPAADAGQVSPASQRLLVVRQDTQAAAPPAAAVVGSGRTDNPRFVVLPTAPQGSYLLQQQVQTGHAAGAAAAPFIMGAAAAGGGISHSLQSHTDMHAAVYRSRHGQAAAGAAGHALEYEDPVVSAPTAGLVGYLLGGPVGAAVEASPRYINLATIPQVPVLQSQHISQLPAGQSGAASVVGMAPDLTGSARAQDLHAAAVAAAQQQQQARAIGGAAGNTELQHWIPVDLMTPSPQLGTPALMTAPGHPTQPRQVMYAGSACGPSGPQQAPLDHYQQQQQLVAVPEHQLSGGQQPPPRLQLLSVQQQEPLPSQQYRQQIMVVPTYDSSTMTGHRGQQLVWSPAMHLGSSQQLLLHQAGNPVPASGMLQAAAAAARPEGASPHGTFGTRSAQLPYVTPGNVQGSFQLSNPLPELGAPAGSAADAANTTGISLEALQGVLHQLSLYEAP